jgi:hypothetical protein
MSYEEKKRLLYEKLAQGFPRDKPSVSVVTVPVSAFAEKAKANPSGVRVVVVGRDGHSGFEPPKPNPNHVKVLVDRSQRWTLTAALSGRSLSNMNTTPLTDCAEKSRR